MVAYYAISLFDLKESIPNGNIKAMSNKIRNFVESKLTMMHCSPDHLADIASDQMDGKIGLYRGKEKYVDVTGKTHRGWGVGFVLGNCPCCDDGLTLFAQIHDRKGRVIDQSQRPVAPDVLDELEEVLGYCPVCAFSSGVDA